MKVCKVLRDAFFGHNREQVFEAIPELPPEVFGAYETAPLVPFGEKFGVIPVADIIMPKGASLIRYGVSNEDMPETGFWMEHSEPVTDDLEIPTLKGQILATCLIRGNRYGCCWFIGFA